LTFDLLISKWGRESSVSSASLQPMFSFLRPSVLDLGSGTGQRDRWTERQGSSLHNAARYEGGDNKPITENHLMLTNRANRLEVNQCHQTWYHSISQVWFPISMLQELCPEVFEIFDLTLKPGLAVTQCHQNTRIDPSPDFLLTFHSNQGPISYRFRGKRRFQSKICTLSNPSMYLPPPPRGSPSNFVTAIALPKTGSCSYKMAERD